MSNWAYQTGSLKEELMKKALGILFILALVFFGFAVAFQFGQIIGFDTGSEWAIMQAAIVAREAGVFMPVYMSNGSFRVVLRQPPGLYKRVWQFADRHEDAKNAVIEQAEEQTEDRAPAPDTLKISFMVDDAEPLVCQN
jgi:hypothetical protein